MPKKLKRIPYSTVADLLRYELKNDEGEHEGTATLIKQLRHIRKTKNITRSEFLAICHWKSPRAVKHYSKNIEKTIQTAVCTALTTRSERRKLDCLTKLRGVNIPMASAILTLTNPQRYGVIGHGAPPEVEDFERAQILRQLCPFRFLPSIANQRWSQSDCLQRFAHVTIIWPTLW